MTRTPAAYCPPAAVLRGGRRLRVPPSLRPAVVAPAPPSEVGAPDAGTEPPSTTDYPPSLQPDPILPFLQEYPHTCCMLELQYCLHRRRRITDETKKEVNRMQNLRGALVNMIYSIPR